MFQKNILEWIFVLWISIPEKHFAYRTPIPKIPFAYEIFILESSKIIKNNSGIT